MAVKNYTKPAVRNAWADDPPNGASDFVDPGNTFADQGWPVGQKPPRQYVNWALNWTSAAVRYFCQQGIATWDIAEVYGVGGIVKGSDNRIYESKVVSNTGIDPTADNGTHWGPAQGASPANADNSNALSTTAWVTTNFLAKGTSIQSLAGTLANGQLVVGNVTQFQGSLAIGGGQVTSAVAQANTLRINGYATFNWSGQSGQPPWLFGSSDGVNVFVWNPSNFSVANSALLVGLAPNSNVSGNSIAQRDPNGYLFAAYFNQGSPNNENPPISQVMVTNGADNFLRKASLAALASALAGAQSLTTPGYARLPGGLIIQWGQINLGDIPGNGTVQGTATFPITFPNNILGLSADSLDSNGGLGSYVWNTTAQGRNFVSFGAHEVISGVVQNTWFQYVAVGN